MNRDQLLIQRFADFCVEEICWEKATIGLAAMLSSSCRIGLELVHAWNKGRSPARHVLKALLHALSWDANRQWQWHGHWHNMG